MSIEDKVLSYREKVEKLKALEKEITELLPDRVWDEYHNLQLEVASDKGVLQKKIKEGQQTVEVGSLVFKVSTRARTHIPDSFMYTAQDLGHLGTLVDLGVITGIKVNEDMIGRLDPELSGIYSNLVEKKQYTSLTWPKKADK